MPFFSLQPSYPVRRHVFRMWLFSFVFPALLVAAILVAAVVLGAAHLPDLSAGPRPPSGSVRDKLLHFVIVVGYSPVFETLLLALVITLATRFRLSHNLTALITATGFAVWHSLSWAPWGPLVFWPFYLMSRIFLAWRPEGFWRACYVVTLTHAAHNLVPALLGVISR